ERAADHQLDSRSAGLPPRHFAPPLLRAWIEFRAPHVAVEPLGSDLRPLFAPARARCRVPAGGASGPSRFRRSECCPVAAASIAFRSLRSLPTSPLFRS